MPLAWLKDCPQSYPRRLETSLLGQLFIFRTIFSSASGIISRYTSRRKGLFTIIHQGWDKSLLCTHKGFPNSPLLCFETSFSATFSTPELFSFAYDRSQESSEGLGSRMKVHIATHASVFAEHAQLRRVSHS